MTFNQQAADAVYGQIIKMDADSALVYGRMLLGAAVQHDLIVNGDQIAETVSKVLAERVETARAGLIRTSVSKARNGEDNTVELATLVELEKGFFGSLFSTVARSQRTHDQRRDPATGRFEVMHEQIHEDPKAEVIPGRYAGRLGLPDPAHKDLEGLTTAQKAQLQNGYAQVQRLIRPYASMPGNKAIVSYHYDDGAPTHQTANAGIPKIAGLHQREVEVDDGNGGKKKETVTERGTDGIDPTRKLRAVTVDVVPGNDAAGGLFRTFNALGMPKVGSMVAGAATRDGGALNPEGVASFGREWNRKENDWQFQPGGQAFNRTIAGSKLIEDSFGPTLPPQVKMATQVAQHIGRLGPAASKIVAPTMDRAAYRYRGTERTPDRRLLNAQTNDKLTTTKLGGVATELQRRAQVERQQAKDEFRQAEFTHRKATEKIKADWDDAAQQFQRGVISGKDYHRRRKEGQKALSAHAERLAAARKTYDKRVGETSNNEHLGAQMSHETWVKSMVNGYTDRSKIWHESQVLGYMRDRIPSAELNELQLKSGVVPPSEGIIIGGDGKVKAQTVGYGDDHYLPFTLRNLASLRGGYYVRTRTFGGPTSEDIYTALVSGAKGLTVVSNNGTFSMEFDHDFKGGRRFNDKAARMVARYGNLLDAVRSGNVPGGDVSPSRMRELHQRVAQEAPGDAGAQKRLLDTYTKKERSNPTLSGEEREQVTVDYLAGRLNDSGAEVADTGAGRPGMMSSRRMQSDALSMDEIAMYAANQVAARSGHSDPGVRRGHTQMQFDQWMADPATMPDKVADALGERAGVERALKDANEQNRKRMQALQLDGRGYQVALEALQQQFPYYLNKPEFHDAHDGVDNIDTGYVKPKHNRTENALVGYYDKSIAGGGKATADSIRFQNGRATPNWVTGGAAAPRVDQVLGDTPAAAEAGEQAAEAGRGAPARGFTPRPGAATGTREPTDAELQLKADIALVKHLHSLTDTPFGEAAGKKFTPPMATAKVRTLTTQFAGEATVDPLRKVFGTNTSKVSESEAVGALGRGDLTHDDLTQAVKFLQDGDMWVGSLNQGVVDNHIRRGKAIPIVRFSETDPAAAWKEPDRDWDWSHWSPLFTKGSGAVPAELDAYYNGGENNQFTKYINSGALPPTLGASDFLQRTNAMLKQAEDAQAAHTEWVANGKLGQEPMNTRKQYEMAAVATQARQLHRRQREATQRVDAAAAREEELKPKATEVVFVQPDENGGVKAIDPPSPENEPDWMKHLKGNPVARS